MGKLGGPRPLRLPILQIQSRRMGQCTTGHSEVRLLHTERNFERHRIF